MTRTRLGMLLASCLLSLASPGRAAQEPSCNQPNALSAVACELTRALGAQATSALVVARDARGDRPLVDASALSSRLARVVAGRIGQETRAARETATLPTARGMARERGSLLYLEPVIERGRLAVTASLYPVRLGFWDRIRMQPPGPSAHAYAERPIDPEIVSFLQIPDLVLGTRVRARFSGGQILALACGRNLSSGALELVLSTRHRVHIGNIQHGVFASRAEAAWSDLAPVAAVPLRQPLGAARFEGGSVSVGISDRQSAIALSPELSTVKALGGQVPWSRDVCLSVQDVALGGPVPCRARAAQSLAVLDGPVDAVAAYDAVDARGLLQLYRASRDARTSTVRVHRGPSPQVSAELPDSGAQIALGDLDLDGRIEVLVSKNTLQRRDDSLSIHTWDLDRGLELRAELPVATGIDALAVCPHDDAPLAQAVIATQGGLWVLG